MSADTNLAAEIRVLREALEAARDHLEYCGYGDRWERAGAMDSGLPEIIDRALRTTAANDEGP